MASLLRGSHSHLAIRVLLFAWLLGPSPAFAQPESKPPQGTSLTAEQRQQRQTEDGEVIAFDALNDHLGSRIHERVVETTSAQCSLLGADVEGDATLASRIDGRNYARNMSLENVALVIDIVLDCHRRRLGDKPTRQQCRRGSNQQRGHQR